MTCGVERAQPPKAFSLVLNVPNLQERATEVGRYDIFFLSQKRNKILIVRRDKKVIANSTAELFKPVRYVITYSFTIILYRSKNTSHHSTTFKILFLRIHFQTLHADTHRASKLHTTTCTKAEITGCSQTKGWSQGGGRNHRSPLLSLRSLLFSCQHLPLIENKEFLVKVVGAWFHSVRRNHGFYLQSRK